MDPRVSVIIPTYNCGAFIREAVESVLAQTYPAREIIVIDDGSTDGTSQILDSFKDRIIYKRIPNSGGPSMPRNVAMLRATGDYLAFLDADDSWMADKLEVQVDFCRRFRKADFFCSNYVTRFRGADDELVPQFSEARFREELAAGLLRFDEPFDAAPLLARRNFVGCPSAVMVSRRLVNIVGMFDLDHVGLEDYDYWLRCCEFTRVVAVSRVLAEKRNHGANLSADHVGFALRRYKMLRRHLRHNHYLRDRGLVGELKDNLARTACVILIGQSNGKKGAEKFLFYLRHLPRYLSFKFIRLILERLLTKLHATRSHPNPVDAVCKPNGSKRIANKSALTKWRFNPNRLVEK